MGLDRVKDKLPGCFGWFLWPTGLELCFTRRVFSRPPALAQQLATEIEKSIIDRQLLSGDRIATMDELREQSGYGRATIGETARLLSERGSVEVRPGRGGGLFVAPQSPAVQIRRTLLMAPQGGSTVGDAIAVREALEELIALDAARHRTPDDIADLRGLHERHAGSRHRLGRFHGRQLGHCTSGLPPSPRTAWRAASIWPPSAASPNSRSTPRPTTTMTPRIT